MIRTNRLVLLSIEPTVRMYRSILIQILRRIIYLDTEHRQSYYYQLLILRRLYSQPSIKVRRKSFELYKNSTTVLISSIRKRQQPLGLYAPILLARSLITILNIPSKEIPSIMSLHYLSRQSLRPITLRRLTQLPNILK